MQRSKIFFKGIFICAILSASSQSFAWGSQRPKNPTPPTKPPVTPPVTPPVAPPVTPPVTPPPSNPPSGTDLSAVLSDISKIATTSSCAAYSWKNRGRAPSGYMAGMAVTFAKSLCRERASETPAKLLASKNSGNLDKDVLAWYESAFDASNLEIDISGPDTLRSLYTLGVGLGMRESSGKYCEGYDVSGGADVSSEAEAGLFQTSYNSVNSSSELRKLYDEYKADKSKCFLDTFKPGVSCTARGFIGTGEGLVFQQLAKSCPAFAAEFAMLTLRTIRKHYGPINRKEAELNSSCGQMLDSVQSYVEDRSAIVCSNLLVD
jgi:hypothetical protein